MLSIAHYFLKIHVATIFCSVLNTFSFISGSGNAFKGTVSIYKAINKVALGRER